jgi:hypothetical protein
MNAKVNATIILTSEQIKLSKALIKACQNEVKASAAVTVAICNSIAGKAPTSTIIDDAVKGFGGTLPSAKVGDDMHKSVYASMIRRLAAAPADIITKVLDTGKALHPKVMIECEVPGIRPVSEKALAARAAKAAAKATPKVETPKVETPKVEAPIDLAGVLLQMHGIRAALNLKTADQALLECCNAFIANLSMIVTKEKNLDKAKARKPMSYKVAK